MIKKMGLRRFLFLVGDVTAFYLALLATLIIRWQDDFNLAIFLEHLMPFTVFLVLGLWIFYAMQLYDANFGYPASGWMRSASVALTLQFVAAVFFFYFISRSPQAITPRGTLFLFFVLFTLFFLGSRTLISRLVSKKGGSRTLIFGSGQEAEQLTQRLNSFPELGYRVVALLSEEELELKQLGKLIKEENIEVVVANREAFGKLIGAIFELAKFNVNFWDLASFYETVLEKIPLGLVSEVWILENVMRKESLLITAVKQVIDTILASILLIISLPLWPLIALGVKLSSPGPVFYEHLRVGQHNKTFVLRKFRSMYQNAEPTGPRWSEPNDPMVTPFGKFTRKTHLDELPQLISIIQGDLSFVGPRPERPEFVKELKEKIPFYAVRHLIKPGLSGWAQIKYPYGASIEDAIEKLEYDLYYLKHRSPLLDLSIVLKTIRLLFQNPQKIK